MIDYADGTYYFIVEARNSVGTLLSNCIEVIIQNDYSSLIRGSFTLILGGSIILAAVVIMVTFMHKREVNRIQ